MTRTPDEIKKGLECALCDEPADLCGEDCPCWSAYSPAEMRQDEHVADALAYIQQLEAENERLQRYYATEADRKISRRRVEKIAEAMEQEPTVARAYLERCYPGYEVLEMAVRTSKWVTGAYVRAVMVRRE